MFSVAKRWSLFYHRINNHFSYIYIFKATWQVAGSVLQSLSWQYSQMRTCRRRLISRRGFILKWVSCADKSPRLQVNFRHVWVTLICVDRLRLQTGPRRLPQQATAPQQADGQTGTPLSCPAGTRCRAQPHYSCLSGICLSAAWRSPHPATPICWDPSLSQSMAGDICQHV